MSRFALCLFASASHCEQKAADVPGHKMQMSAARKCRCPQPENADVRSQKMQMSAARKALAPQRINEYNNRVLSGSDGYSGHEHPENYTNERKRVSCFTK